MSAEHRVVLCVASPPVPRSKKPSDLDISMLEAGPGASGGEAEAQSVLSPPSSGRMVLSPATSVGLGPELASFLFPQVLSAGASGGHPTLPDGASVDRPGSGAVSVEVPENLKAGHRFDSASETPVPAPAPAATSKNAGSSSSAPSSSRQQERSQRSAAGARAAAGAPPKVADPASAGNAGGRASDLGVPGTSSSSASDADASRGSRPGPHGKPSQRGPRKGGAPPPPEGAPREGLPRPFKGANGSTPAGGPAAEDRLAVFFAESSRAGVRNLHGPWTPEDLSPDAVAEFRACSDDVQAQVVAELAMFRYHRARRDDRLGQFLKLIDRVRRGGAGAAAADVPGEGSATAARPPVGGQEQEPGAFSPGKSRGLRGQPLTQAPRLRPQTARLALDEFMEGADPSDPLRLHRSHLPPQMWDYWHTAPEAAQLKVLEELRTSLANIRIGEPHYPPLTKFLWSSFCLSQAILFCPALQHRF